ncbi:MAG: peptidylprolyl isomerase, partial [Pseudolabrys sp.]
MTTALFAGIPAAARRAAYLTACLAAVSALLIVSAAPLRAQDKDPVIAKVNGIEIHQSDLKIAEEEAGQLPPMSPNAKRDYLVQFMADMFLVSKAAEAKKMGDGADFKRKL